MKKLLIAVLLISALATSATVRAAEDAKTNYTKNCAGCHGKEGKGDTKLGQKFEAKDYSDPKVQAAVKDEAMFKAIKEGYKRGDKVIMKPYADKFTDQEIKELVKYMRDFKK